MNPRTIGKGIGFERIRRITGYLTGSLERWGNAKRAEEKDRVKHGTDENTSGATNLQAGSLNSIKSIKI